MLGMLLMYWMVGIIVCCLVVIIHLFNAERQGYWAFDYWEGALPEIEGKPTTSQLLWSMCIWPIRLWQFIVFVPTFYDIYQWRKYGPRTRKGWL